MDLYIYYRAHCDDAQKLQECVHPMQAELTKKYGVKTALKRRPDIKNTTHTWMEVYLDIPDDFDAILQLIVTETGLSALIDGERHTEHFLDLSSCV